MSDTNKRFLIVAVEESDSSVGFYDSQDGSEVARVDVGFWPHEIDLSPDRRFAFVTNFGVKDYDERIGRAGASISIIDVKTKCEVDRLYTFENREQYKRFRGPHGIKITPDGKRAFVNVETEDTLLIYDLDDRQSKTPVESWAAPATILGPSGDVSFGTEFESLPDRQHSLPVGTHYMLFSPCAKYLWVVSGRGGVTELDVETGRPLRGFQCNGAVRGLSYTVDQSKLIASASNEICIVDPVTLRVEKRFSDLGVRQFLYSQPTPDGKYILAPAVWEGQLLRIDIESGAVERMVVGSDPIHAMPSPDPESTSAYVTHGRSKFISVVDWSEFKETGRIKTRGGPNGIAWAPYSDRPERKTLNVGACLPLSGSTIVEGQDLRLGYQYWQELVNNAGGIQAGEDVYEVKLHFADSVSKTGMESDEPQPWMEPPEKRDPPERNSVEVLTAKLVEDKDVKLLFGGYPSPPNLHSGRIAEENGIPLITASGAAGIIYSKGLRNVFGAMTVAKGFLNETFRFFNTIESPPRSVLFLACKDPAARQDAETTAAYIQSNLDMEILTSDSWAERGENGVLLFDHGNQEFDELIDIAIDLQPDVVAITGHLPESVAFVRQANRRRFLPKAIVFSVGPAIPQFVDQLKGLSRHIIGTAMWSHTQESFGHDRFILPEAFEREFMARFSRRPAYLAAGAMACGLAYEAAVRLCGSVDGAKVSAALRETDFESFYSRIHFNEDGFNEGRPLLTIQLGGDEDEIKHVPLWPEQLASGGELTWPMPGWPEEPETNASSHQH